MSATILVNCPQCTTQLKLNQPQGPVIVTCPSCGQKIQLAGPQGGAAPGPTRPARPANPFENLPAPSIPAAAPPPPPKPKPKKQPKKSKPASSKLVQQPIGPAQSKFQAPVHRPRQPAKTTDFKTPLIGLICLVTLVTSLAIFWKDLPTESLMALIPVLDSPESILKDYVNIADSLGSTLESIEDGDSRDAAIPKIQKLTERCKGLSNRAVAVGPLSAEKLESLGTWFKTQIPDRSKRVKQSADRVNQMRDLASDELRSALIDYTFAMSDVGQTMQAAWQPIPEPTDEKHRAEYEATLVRRELWGKLASVSSESDYSRLGKVYDSAASKLETIETEHGKIKESGAFSPYFSINVSLSMSTSSTLSNLSEKYGSIPDQDAVDRYTQAAAALKGDDSLNQGDPAMAGPPSSRRPGAVDSPGGPPRRPFERPPGAATAFERSFQMQIESYRRRNPPDQVVVIHIERSDMTSSIQSIRDMVVDDLKARQHSVRFAGEKGIALFVYDGPLSDVVDNIDWGTIKSTDESSRTIHVNYN